ALCWRHRITRVGLLHRARPFVCELALRRVLVLVASEEKHEDDRMTQHERGDEPTSIPERPLRARAFGQQLHVRALVRQLQRQALRARVGYADLRRRQKEDLASRAWILAVHEQTLAE